MKVAFFITVLSSILFLQDVFAAKAKESAVNTPELNLAIEELMNSDDKVVETKKSRSPTVGDYMKNIYNEEYFSKTVMSDYFDAFYTGYNMQDYAFAEECQEYGTDLMDQLYEFHLNMTRRKSALDPYYLTVHIFGNEINDSWFYCYQWGNDLYEVYQTKADNFVDFGDVYLSFIFNLLSNSLNIKTSTENMIEAKDDHDTAYFIQNLA